MNQTTLRALRSGLKLGPQVTIIADPKKVLYDAAEVTDHIETGGARRPTPWMQRLAGRSRSVAATEYGRVPLFEGRACCFEHLHRFDGRADLQLPFETTCPGCDRVFRVTLGLTTTRR